MDYAKTICMIPEMSSISSAIHPRPLKTRALSLDFHKNSLQITYPTFKFLTLYQQRQHFPLINCTTHLCTKLISLLVTHLSLDDAKQKRKMTFISHDHMSFLPQYYNMLILSLSSIHFLQ